MKILGLFRGFPGLGRVVAGVSLLETLKSQFGFQIRAISYMQGNSYLRNKGFEILNEITDKDICSIGLLPTNHFAESIFNIIKEFSPSVVLVDGEPLLIKSLRISFPLIKIVTLLNPSDVVNENNNKEAMEFLNDCYQNSDLAIVHGSRQINGNHGYKKLISIPTIIRPEILNVIRNPQKKIYCILGGGTLNVGTEFVETTLKIANLCINAAPFIPNYTFDIVCSSDNIYSQLKGKKIAKNILLIRGIINAEKYYQEADLIVTRSGRNTLGETATIGIPTLSFICGCEYRKHEQKANILALQNSLIKCVNIDIAVEDFVALIKNQICKQGKYNSQIGNEQALSAILELYRENGNLNYHNSCQWLRDFNQAKELSDVNKKKISLRKLRSDIFKENIDIVSKNYFINELGQKVFLNKKNSYAVFYGNEIKLESAKDRCHTKISVCNEDSIDCGIRLLDLGYNPIVLNIFCADGPNGSVISGCYGQEESLFRRTNLYEYMYRYATYAEVFGIIKSSKQYSLESEYKGVYVHNVCVFRKREDEGYQLLDRSYNLSFVVISAFNNPSSVNGKLKESDKIATENKVRTILRIAIVNHHNALVFDALGCDIFNNSPIEIVYLFRKILNEYEFKNRLEIVYFSILEDKCSIPNSVKGNYIT